MKRNILIIVDAQNDFIDGALSNEVAQSRVSNIVERINNFTNGVIVLTKDTHSENYLNTKEGKKLPIKHCVRGSDGWEINSDILKAVDTKITNDKSVKMVVLCKPTFGSGELLGVVDGIASSVNYDVYVEVMGFCTDICVISNVLMLKARYYETFDINVVENCCAGVTPEKHKAALDVMESCQINVI